MIQAERHLRFGRDVDVLALGQSLCACSGRTTSECSDSRTFTATGNRPDQRARERPAANILRGTLVFPDSFFAAAIFRDRVRCNGVAVSINGQSFQTERDLVSRRAFSRD